MLSSLIKFTFAMLSTHKFTFAMLSSPKIHTCNAQLPENSHSQYSALIKFTFTKLSYHKINFQKSQLSSHNNSTHNAQPS